MKLSNVKAQIYIPDGSDNLTALNRTTHLCIAAHQDDVEIMAYSAIAECYDNDKKWFTAVVLTDGAGSPRACEFATFTDDEMQEVRKKEQNEAAIKGKYSAIIQLGYPSNSIKTSNESLCITELSEIIKTCTPEIIFTHNPADKHDTHVATMLRTLEAIRILPKDAHPQKVFALEVWRGLDWLMDESKTIFDTSLNPDLAKQLLTTFKSQNNGGKRYDLATLGRRHANATFYTPHTVDTVTSCTYGLDITELISNPDVVGFIGKHINNFHDDVNKRINQLI